MTSLSLSVSFSLTGGASDVTSVDISSLQRLRTATWNNAVCSKPGRGWCAGLVTRGGSLSPVSDNDHIWHGHVRKDRSPTPINNPLRRFQTEDKNSLPVETLDKTNHMYVYWMKQYQSLLEYADPLLTFVSDKWLTCGCQLLHSKGMLTLTAPGYISLMTLEVCTRISYTEWVHASRDHRQACAQVEWYMLQFVRCTW